MNILNLFIPLALVVAAAGCESNKPREASRTTTTTKVTQTTVPRQNAPPATAEQVPRPAAIQQITTDKATYTIETIPNTRLTPTSREGDGTDHIYSSNIIAVYVHTNNSVTVDSTNAPTIPKPANTAQPENK